MDKATQNIDGHTSAKSGLLCRLADDIVAINIANGWNVAKPSDWNDTYKVPAILALVTSEVSEALEAFRSRDQENFSEELADIIIRVLDLAGGMAIDIDKSVADKIEINRIRGYKHGGKFV